MSGCAVSWVAASADGKIMATADSAGNLRLAAVPDVGPPVVGEPQQTGQKAVLAGAFARDAPLFATGGDDGTVGLWNASGPGAATAVGPALTGHSGPVRSVAISRTVISSPRAAPTAPSSSGTSHGPTSRGGSARRWRPRCRPSA